MEVKLNLDIGLPEVSVSVKQMLRYIRAITRNKIGMNLTIFLSNFTRFTLDSQHVFKVNEGKRTNKNRENRTPSVP